MASAKNTATSCVSCGHRVPITLRDLFWQDPFFSSNWEDFHKIHDEMMAETRAIWNKFDEQLKVVSSSSPLYNYCSDPFSLNLGKFLKNLENHPGIFDVQSISLETDTKSY